jgi:hypothetical protein
MLLLLAGCVAPRRYDWERTDLIVELEEGEREVRLELVLDIRPEAMPDPDVYVGDELLVWVDLPGKFELDVMLDGEEKPAKGGRAEDYDSFFLPDLTPRCPDRGACQHVVQLEVQRLRTRPAELLLTADWSMWTTQAAVTFFPSAATEQEIRLRVFER